MIAWIDKHRDMGGLGHQIMEKSQPLGRNFSGEKIDPSRVAARLGKAGDQTKPDGVLADAEDDRDRCGRSLGRLSNGGLAGRSDNGYVPADEVSHECRQAIVSALQPVVLDHHVLALDVAGFVEGFAERSRIAPRGLGRPNIDEADDRHRRLLRACSKRPRSRRSAEQSDEIAPPNHSITSSASESRLSEILTSSALAVLRLITVSNLVGCSTGRSAGFAPLRIRAVYTPYCRYASVMLTP